MNQQLQAAQAVMRDLRGYRQQYQSISSAYAKMKQELYDVKLKVLSYDLACTPVYNTHTDDLTTCHSRQGR